MSKKKAPNNYELDELLDLLDQESPEIKEEAFIKDDDEVLGFISYYNIKPGENRVSVTLLKELFRKWTNSSISSDLFFKEFSKYFTRYCDAKRAYYGLNLDSLALAEKAKKVLLKKPNRTKSKTAKLHFEGFLGHYNISEGNLWVSLSSVYVLYNKWTTTKSASKTTLSKASLRKFMDLYFESKKAMNKIWFKLNNEIRDHFYDFKGLTDNGKEKNKKV